MHYTSWVIFRIHRRFHNSSSITISRCAVLHGGVHHLSHVIEGERIDMVVNDGMAKMRKNTGGDGVGKGGNIDDSDEREETGVND